MRLWFSGPRVLGGLIRPGISLGKEDLRALGKKPPMAIAAETTLVLFRRADGAILLAIKDKTENMTDVQPVGAFVFASVPKSVSVREGAMVRLARHIEGGLIVGQSVGQIVAAIKAEANALDIETSFVRVETEPEKPKTEPEKPKAPPYRMYGSQAEGGRSVETEPERPKAQGRDQSGIVGEIIIAVIFWGFVIGVPILLYYFTTLLPDPPRGLRPTPRTASGGLSGDINAPRRAGPKSGRQ